MIKYIKRKDLEDDKYDACIENAIQSRIYALSWYLDIVADHWDVLVLDDYKAVMPIPWKQKYLLKYVTQPLFCQQLGVFSSKKISKNQLKTFFSKVPSRFVKVSLCLNPSNYFDDDSNTRKNYILNLSSDYQSLLANFSRTRRQRVKLGIKNNLKVKPVAIDKLIEIQKRNYNYDGFSETIILDISESATEFGRVEVFGVYKENELLGGGLFVKHQERIIYLFSSFTNNGRKYQAATFLINYIIEQNQQQNKVLDFEGGNMKSIGDFFRSFGAEKETLTMFSRKLFKL